MGRYAYSYNYFFFIKPCSQADVYGLHVCRYCIAADFAAACGEKSVLALNTDLSHKKVDSVERTTYNCIRVEIGWVNTNPGLMHGSLFLWVIRLLGLTWVYNTL